VLRHEVTPGRLVVGAAAVAASVLYTGEAAGLWHTRWYYALSLVFGGLWLASIVGGAAQRARSVRRRRRLAQSESAENMGAPATTSGSQAIR
jgi:hypothetical protein